MYVHVDESSLFPCMLKNFQDENLKDKRGRGWLLLNKVFYHDDIYLNCLSVSLNAVDRISTFQLYITSTAHIETRCTITRWRIRHWDEELKVVSVPFSSFFCLQYISSFQFSRVARRGFGSRLIGLIWFHGWFRLSSQIFGTLTFITFWIMD